VTARGAITAIAPAAPAPPTSITVAGVTCTVPANLQSSVAALKVGVVTTISCDVVSGVNTLVQIGENSSKYGKSSNRRHD
jgi:hypothetical protein